MLRRSWSKLGTTLDSATASQKRKYDQAVGHGSGMQGEVDQAVDQADDMCIAKANVTVMPSIEMRKGSICRFGSLCKRSHCWHEHPEGRLIDEDPSLALQAACKFGYRCNQLECIYGHPDGRLIDEGRQDRFVCVLDEFAFPRELLPPPQKWQTEVFIDAIPGDPSSPEFHDFFSTFTNDISSVHVELLQDRSRGYVRFPTHVAAAACVDVGIARWSESERALSEKWSSGHGKHGNPNITKAEKWKQWNVNNRNLLLRRLHKELINPKSKRDYDVVDLRLFHGDGVGGEKGTKIPISKHVHFTGKGTEAQVLAFRSLTEDVIATFFKDLSERGGPCKLCIRGLPQDWTVEKAMLYFDYYGQMKSLSLFENGPLEVTYRRSSSAESALQDINGSDFGGRTLVHGELVQDTNEDDVTCDVRIDLIEAPPSSVGLNSSPRTPPPGPALSLRPRPSTAPHLHNPQGATLPQPRPSKAAYLQNESRGNDLLESCAGAWGETAKMHGRPPGCWDVSEKNKHYRCIVKDLSRDVTVCELHSLFAPFGKLISTLLRGVDDSGKSKKGQGLVVFSTEKEATAAYVALNGKTLHGQAMVVHEPKEVDAIQAMEPVERPPDETSGRPTLSPD